MNTIRGHSDMIVLQTIVELQKEKGDKARISMMDILSRIKKNTQHGISIRHAWKLLRTLEEDGYILRYSILPRYIKRGITANRYEITEKGHEKLMDWQKSKVMII